MSKTTLVRSLHHAKVCFIPFPANNHHPLALRHKPLTAISLLLVITKIVAISIVGLTPSEATLSTITTNRIIQLTNEERGNTGLPALAVNSKLAQAAQLKANDMLKNQYFAHISPTNVTPWHWMEQTGYSYEVAGENLAIDFTQAEDVVSAWLASPKHKENMLRKDYTETGVAIASGKFKDSTSIIVVHMFGKPSQASTPASSPTSPLPAEALAQVEPSALLQARALPPKLTPTITPTPSPSPAPVIASIILSPSFDQEEFAIAPAHASTSSWQLFSVHSAIASDTDVVSAIPLFTIHPVSKTSTTFFAFTSRISRDMSASIALAMCALLLIAVFVRVKVQHPLMIAHASVVIVLAFALFIA
ncbi:MAG: hypothetical protein A3E36_04670 [Candidatus Andersenbacteria bacterium RIFCSPHIGHO2_12_FULL_45_11b]|uniref:SCP domain-containing protein n=1 Tax=Candidatus Andersenbacteria bacterium RIFCSPHIGHO2_12_FULL_45_11b TaxID=1797282 RepID=A0A1G1XC68_9BACT|nr:MAG: hypothetical protein A3E36_04670 [Candidatus Andersenbacteria bacterium RIFCSPHIGHO2_12_FULL_45_11b]